MPERHAQLELPHLVRTTRSAAAGRDAPRAFAGEAPVTRRLCEQLRAAAALRGPVLITGESGSGRARAARCLHASGEAPSAPFVELHAPPPRRSLPSEGTLLVRELCALSPAGQAEWREWLAAARPELRFVASAQSAYPPLPADRALFELLRRVELRVPALRERRDDLAALAADMAREIASERGEAPLRLSAREIAAFARAPWVATAADLRRVLERAAANEATGEAGGVAAAIAALRPSVAAMRERARARERVALLAALDAAGGNLTAAARQLGRSRAAVYRLIAKHGIALGPAA